MSSTALLVIEGLWWTPEQKPKRPSVLSFLEGLESYRGDFNIYYANFYEKEGFRRALADDLTNTREGRLFLYVAAHGTGKRIGGLKARTGMKLPAMFKAVKDAGLRLDIQAPLPQFPSMTMALEHFIKDFNKNDSKNGKLPIEDKTEVKLK